jgi:hypothetical protein
VLEAYRQRLSHGIPSCSPSSQLRSELEADPASPAFILTDPGVGYRFVEPAPIS